MFRDFRLRVVGHAGTAAITLVSSGGAANAGELQEVSTAEGVAFSLPGSFQEAPSTTPEEALVRLYMDASHDAIRVMIGGGPIDSHAWAVRFPIASGALPAALGQTLAADWVKAFAPTVDESDFRYDSRSLDFDKERHAFAFQVAATLASPAWLALQEDDASPQWQAVRRGGAPLAMRCLVEQLLSGSKEAEPEQLRLRFGGAAIHCDTALPEVEEFVERVTRTGLFASRGLAATVIGIVTRDRVTYLSVVGPQEEALYVDSLSSLIWTTAGVAPAARIEYGLGERLKEGFSLLPTDGRARTAAELVEYTTRKQRSIWGVLTTISLATGGGGALLALLLARLGVRAPASVVVGLVGFSAFFAYKAIERGALSTTYLPTVLIHVIIGLVAYFPTRGWLRRRAQGGVES
jgi:hypothetical protein